MTLYDQKGRHNMVLVVLLSWVDGNVVKKDNYILLGMLNLKQKLNHLVHHCRRADRFSARLLQIQRVPPAAIGAHVVV